MATLAGLGEPDAPDRLAACLDAPVAWQDIVAEARRMRVAPLLYAGLRTATENGIPAEAMESLRRAALGAAARSAQLEQAAAPVVRAASEAGIPILLLKGLALQHLVYPAGVVRPMDDVDVLVSARDRPRLDSLLCKRGYNNDLRGEEDYFAPDRSHSIDVHCTLVNTTRLPARGALWTEDFSMLWERRQPLVVGGVAGWTLGPRDTVQHLAIHAVHHHGMDGVLWMADLLAILRTWPQAAAELCNGPSGVQRSVWYCLEVLALREEDPVPAVRAALRPKRFFPREKQLVETIARGACLSHARYGLTLSCLPRWRDRVGFLRQLLFPSQTIYSAGFSDAGTPPRWTWLAHWHHIARLAMRSRRRVSPRRQ